MSKTAWRMRLWSTSACQRARSVESASGEEATANAQVVVTEFQCARANRPSHVTPVGSGAGTAPRNAQESRCRR